MEKYNQAYAAFAAWLKGSCLYRQFISIMWTYVHVYLIYFVCLFVCLVGWLVGWLLVEAHTQFAALGEAYAFFWPQLIEFARNTQVWMHTLAAWLLYVRFVFVSRLRVSLCSYILFI